MSERSFTDLEISVLDRFFTGVKTFENVYCPKPNIPSVLWAFLTGNYSRSQLTMRELFLKTIQDFEGDRYEVVLEGLDARSDADLSKFLLRAESFLSKWSVAYGHDSLKDGSVDRFAIEGVSIVATKLLEWPSLLSAQEKSTRYCDFSKVSFIDKYVPAKFQEQANKAFEACRSAYLDVFTSAFNAYYATLQCIEDVLVRERTARAKAFDIARYMLPVTVPTSLGITMPSRETERLLSDLLGSPFAEARDIGEKMFKAGIEVNPSLLKHVKPKTGPGTIKRLMSQDTADPLERFHLPVSYDDQSCEYSDGSVTLHTAPESSPMHPRWLATASALVESESIFDIPLNSIAARVQCMDSYHLHRLVDYLFEARKEHDAVPNGFDVGEMIFSGVLDFGAYRDLQRHRNGFQFRLMPTTTFGYQFPDFIVHREYLLDTCECAIKQLEDLRTEIIDDDKTAPFMTALGAPFEQGLEYLAVLAHNVHFTYVCSVQQAMYIVKLRSSAAGHISYRRFAQSMARCIIQAFPELEAHLQVNWDDDSDRREQEQRTVNKLKNLERGD